MKNSLIRCFPALLAATVLAAAVSAGAAAFNVAVDTTSLVAGAPYTLDFQLTDGSGFGDGNNTVSISDLTIGGAAGPSFSLTDNAFWSQFTYGFTPGSALSFNVSMTSAVDVGGTPDLFSFAIFDDTYASEIPTLAPAGFDAFLLVSFDALTPSVTTFGTDLGRTSLNIPAPTATSVPEGGVPIVLLAGVWLVGFLSYRRRLRAAA